MSRQDSTIIENVKVLMLKGAKGEKGEPGDAYDDTDIRNLINSQNATIADLEELVTDYDVTMLVQNIAALEEGTNGASTHEYNVGDWFIYDSQLYEAITNIAIGDILEVGENIKATTIAEILDNLETTIEGLETETEGLATDINTMENTLEELAKEQFDMYYGLENKTMNYTEDEDGLITDITETSSDAVITTTFRANGDTTMVTTTIEPTLGEYDYTRTIVIEEVASGQTITESYIRTPKGD